MAKTVKVLHLTTYDEMCGIGKYQEQFLKSLEYVAGVENAIFESDVPPTKNRLCLKTGSCGISC